MGTSERNARSAWPARRLRVAALVAAATVVLAGCSLGHHASSSPNPSGKTIPLDLPGWHRTFGDDFNTPLNTTQWGQYNGVPKGGPTALWRTANAYTSNGMLVLHSTKVNGQWVSGGVSNARGGAQLYGRWDIRFRVDKGNGIGYAFLLYPKSGWPPEIDFAEDGGGLRTRSMATTHWAPNNQQTHVYATADFSGWHTISVVWSKTSLDYLIDDRPFGHVTGAGVPQVPMWVGMQSQFKGCTTAYANCPIVSNPDPVDVQIDWIARYVAVAPGTTPTATAGPRPTATSPTPTPSVATLPPGPPASILALTYSTTANRAGPKPLDKATLAGKVYIVAQTTTPASSVSFYLDDPTLSKAPRSVEHGVPLDLAGGTTAAANAFDVSTLTAGQHTITAVLLGTDGSKSTTTSTFTK